MHNIKKYTSPFFLTPYILSAFIALFFPNTYLNIGLIDAFIGVAKGVFPALKSFSDHSDFPFVTEVYMSTSIIMLPSVAWFFIANKDANFSGGFEHQKRLTLSTRLGTVKCAAGILVCVMCGVSILTLPPLKLSIMPIGEHRWALALFGPLFMMIPLGAMIGIINSYLNIIFNKQNRGENGLE